MSNILKELKAEISRLARKEAKVVVSPVKKASATYRGLIAGLRKQVNALQKEVVSLKRTMPKADRVLEAKTEPEGRFWITGKGVKTMRKRTGLTQALFARLVGVSVPTVVNWEGTDGKVEIRRKATMARLQEVKGTGQLRERVHSVLRRLPGVVAFSLAPETMGGRGATVVEVKA